MNASSDHDTVLVAQGTYYENVDFQRKSLSLVSELGADKTIIDGRLLNPVIFNPGATAVIQGFTIRGGAGLIGGGIEISNASPTIRGNVFTANSGFGAGVGGNEASPIVEANEFVGNINCDSQYLAGVLTFVNGSSPAIFNNVIHDNPCVGINMTIPDGDYASPMVFNNTIVRNVVGIYIDNRVSNAHHSYYNNLLYENAVGLEVTFGSGATDAVWKNNLVFGSTPQYSGTVDVSGINGNLDVDPEFVDSANNFFALGFFSPAIDAGTANGAVLPLLDFFGSPRIQPGAEGGLPIVDIGAFEAAPRSNEIFSDGFDG